uniref:Uncharacterized protein n=1 Tax=Anguilla anguilla TaxID=7936 RepID=A0A0E9TSA4_ANGAN
MCIPFYKMYIIMSRPIVLILMYPRVCF